jgi:hypothetical protein
MKIVPKVSDSVTSLRPRRQSGEAISPFHEIAAPLGCSQ